MVVFHCTYAYPYDLWIYFEEGKKDLIETSYKEAHWGLKFY